MRKARSIEPVCEPKGRSISKASALTKRGSVSPKENKLKIRETELSKEVEIRSRKYMGKQKAKAKTEGSATLGVSSGKWSVTRNLPSQGSKAAQSQNK